MTKFAVLTHYYNSKNYGGLLQSYALVTYLNELEGVEACQVPYIMKQKQELVDAQKNLISRLLQKSFSDYLEIIKYMAYNGKVKTVKFYNSLFKKDELQYIKICGELRTKYCKEFEESIPHVEGREYNNENLSELNASFDAFISGSDQVWNPNAYYDGFYLTFADKNKMKISYAASIAVNNYTEKQSNLVIPQIKKFDHIAVREKTGKELLEKYIENKVEVVVDPVLLLSKNDCKKVVKPVIENKKYVYAYLLGERKDIADETKKAAKKLGLPIATVPYFRMKYNNFDSYFGDIKLSDVGPSEFLGLIKHSEIVITTSFHAVVFSIIFEKNFIVIDRQNQNDKSSMNSRITDLLGDLGLLDRLVDINLGIDEEILRKDIDFAYAKKVLRDKIANSKTYLDGVINEVKLNNEENEINE